MSHIVTVKTQVKDVAAIRAACIRLRLAAPEFGRAKLYSSTVEGWAIALPGWRYPLVADSTTGELSFDNYGGKWGAQAELDKFLQAYAVEKAKLEARRKGYSCTESVQADGSIKLTIQTGR